MVGGKNRKTNIRIVLRLDAYSPSGQPTTLRKLQNAYTAFSKTKCCRGRFFAIESGSRGKGKEQSGASEHMRQQGEPSILSACYRKPINHYKSRASRLLMPSAPRSGICRGKDMSKSKMTALRSLAERKLKVELYSTMAGNIIILKFILRAKIDR